MANASEGNAGGESEKDDRRKSEKEWSRIQNLFLTRWFAGLGAAIVFSALSAGIAKGWSGDAPRAVFIVAAVGTAVTVASGTVGWLFGLLFGIPRSVARARTSATSVSGGDGATGVLTSHVNTNLEDVSDWLSKTIIGVGLTQLYAIPHVAWKYATILDQVSLKGEGGGALLILSLAAAGAAGAFWSGYVATRTYLTRLFDLFANGTEQPKPEQHPEGADRATEPAKKGPEHAEN